MITPEQEAILHRLVEVFLAENQKLNLSALRTEEACWVGNILDSLSALDLEVVQTAGSILDIGTGGGFPLLPLAICFPEAKLTGLDATKKKVDAINRIAAAMELRNVSLVSGRAEDLGHEPAHREKYDVVTARATAALPELLELMAPFAKVNGYCIAWKSMHIEKELQDSLGARSALDCHLIKTHEYELPGDWGRRQLLVFQKLKVTSPEFPRAVGIPKKTPIV